jgi:hypothetical protein
MASKLSSFDEIWSFIALFLNSDIRSIYEPFPPSYEFRTYLCNILRYYSLN